jgi:hypothetical protein
MGDGRRVPKETLRIVLPASLQYTAMLHCHDHPLAGHLKHAKTFARVEARFWWDGMFKQTKAWVETCRICQQRKSAPSSSGIRRPLTMIAVEKPFAAVVTDIAGPWQVTPNGNRYVVVVTERCSNWVIAWPVGDITASTVARGLLERLICIHGCPRKIQSDQGSQYTSELIKHVCRMMDMSQRFSTAYAPETQGKVERFNRTFKDMLSKYTENGTHMKGWDELVPWLTFAYNTTKHASTGQVPFEMLYGRQAVLPLESWTPPFFPNQPGSSIMRAT